jgi:hypothetical protein
VTMHPDAHDPARSLAGPVEPPSALKHHVTESLRARDLLARDAWQTPNLRRAVAYAAAAIVLFTGGVMVGKRAGKPAPDLRPRFALLLYEDARFRPSLHPGAHAALEAEYAAWADSLRGQGKLVMGEELDQGETAVLVGAGEPARGPQGDVRSELGTLGGFFIVRADTRDEALTIARQCPHLRYGGRVVLRRLTNS